MSPKLMLTALYAFLTATSPVNPGIVLQDYDANSIVRMIVNTVVGVLTLVGLIYGGWSLWQGFMSQDPKEKQQGFMVLIGSLVIGGFIVTLVNLILA